MPDRLHITGKTEDRPTDRQILFEGAVLSILAHVLESGTRIDIAASEYLAKFPIDPDELHIRADLIICVSDCRHLLRHTVGALGSLHLLLDDTTRRWRETAPSQRLSPQDGATRIQACIGNIRRAIAPRS
ncbi:hypothetical protein [Paramagnetospirillum magnetotacticum]|uniref:hypothetical protein n=1 Tax=Paramagnetospirillum magnetotacticum TaxID=188 RepID=UPI000314EB4F|nr:hypothetical protein [Paramagnetospirillum magnetotacticum]